MSESPGSDRSDRQRLADINSAAEPMLAANEDNILVAASPSALELLGWDRDDLLGRRVTTIIPRHLRARHSTGFTSIVLGGRGQILGRPVQVVALRRDDSEVAVTLQVNVERTGEGRAFFTACLAAT